MDEAIAACEDNVRATIRALIMLNDFLEDELAKVSYGYVRGRVGLQEGV